MKTGVPHSSPQHRIIDVDEGYILEYTVYIISAFVDLGQSEEKSLLIANVAYILKIFQCKHIFESNECTR